MPLPVARIALLTTTLAFGVASCRTTAGEPDPLAPSKTADSTTSLSLESGITIASSTMPASVPNPEEKPQFQGPAMHSFFVDGAVVGNTMDDNYSRYVKFSPSCSFVAYDTDYLDRWQQNDHRNALLRSALQQLISTKTIEEMFTPEHRELFTEAIRSASAPILFPVHIGEAPTPWASDVTSGLRPSLRRAEDCTFRGDYHDHVLHVDGPRGTLQIDEGPVATFRGGEPEVEVTAVDGTVLFVDVTSLREGFTGEVKVGVMGRIERVFTGDMIAQ